MIIYQITLIASYFTISTTINADGERDDEYLTRCAVALLEQELGADLTDLVQDVQVEVLS